MNEHDLSPRNMKSFELLFIKIPRARPLEMTLWVGLDGFDEDSIVLELGQLHILCYMVEFGNLL